MSLYSFVCSAQSNEITSDKKTSQQGSPTNSEYLWVNNLHESVANSVYLSAKWFDEFFIEEGNEISNPKTQARIRLGWRPKSRDWSELETRFRLKIRLPHLKNKVDLILSDEEEDEQNTLPLDGVGTKTSNQDDHFTAALRIISKNSINSQFDSRIGISGSDLFARVKYKKGFLWYDKHAFNLTPSIYYYLDDGLGEKLLLEYNYQISSTEQFRLDYSVRGSETYSGIKWRHGFYKLSQVNEKSASILGLQVEGVRNGDEGFLIEKYTLSYRYRFNAVRKWIYFEVEPFVEFPEDKNYTTTPGISLRVEGYFQKQ